MSYMRRLGYSLEEIKESRTSLNSNRAVDIMKQRSQELRRQWQELLNIDEAIQRKIRFMEQEMDGICLDEIAVKHLRTGSLFPLATRSCCTGRIPFTFIPPLPFMRGTGNTLAPTCIRMMRSCQRPYPVQNPDYPGRRFSLRIPSGRIRGRAGYHPAPARGQAGP